MKGGCLDAFLETISGAVFGSMGATEALGGKMLLEGKQFVKC